MTLSDERLKALLDRAIEDERELLSRRASPHGEAGVALADWSELPRDLYVIEAKRHDIGFDVTMCSVPMVTAPEVRYVRSDFVETALSASPGSSAGADKMWRANLQNAWAAIRMIREAVEEFGPVASLESEDANLLRGPEPVHAAEAIVEALSRVRAALAAAPPQREELEEVTEYDAVLKRAGLMYSTGTLIGNNINGDIYGDRKGRFADGTNVTTSKVRSVEGNIVRTGNSVYRVEWHDEAAIRALTGKGGE